MDTQKIVFVGGPGTGKTATLRKLEEKGYCCFGEISRQVTLEAQKKGVAQLFLKYPLLFSQKLLEGRIAQYQQAKQTSAPICFYDRGIPEVGAYMKYKNEAIPNEFEQAEKNHSYDLVFSFPMWKKIYISDNERYETFEEGLEIQYFIEKSYTDLGYHLISIPKTTVEDRVHFIEKTLKQHDIFK